MIRRRQYLKRSSKPIPRRVRPRQRKRGTRANLARECAALWSAAVKRTTGGQCRMPGAMCSGPIDAAHCLPKGAFPGVRYELWNGMPLCRWHHRWYTDHPGFWNDHLYVVWGPRLYDARRLKATIAGHTKLDLRAVKAALEHAA